MALSWWNLAKAVLAGGIRGTQRVWLCVTLPIPEPLPLTHHHPTLPQDHFPFWGPGRPRPGLPPTPEASRVQRARVMASSLRSSIIKFPQWLASSKQNSIFQTAFALKPVGVFVWVASERQGPGAAGLITKTWVFCIKDLGGEVNEKLLDLSPSCSV